MAGREFGSHRIAWSRHAFGLRPFKKGNHLSLDVDRTSKFETVRQEKAEGWLAEGQLSRFDTPCPLAVQHWIDCFPCRCYTSSHDTLIWGTYTVRGLCQESDHGMCSVSTSDKTVRLPSTYVCTVQSIATTDVSNHGSRLRILVGSRRMYVCMYIQYLSAHGEVARQATSRICRQLS